MGGIISGFMGGAANGAAKVSEIMLKDQIDKERRDSDSLRDFEMQDKQQAFKTSERIASQEFESGETAKKDASNFKVEKLRSKSKSEKDNTTTNMKDAAALKAIGYPADISDGIAHGAIKQLKDEDTGDMVLVNTLTSKPVGRLTTVNNKKVYLADGDQPENAEVSSANRKAAKNATSKKAGYFSTDATDFPSTGGDRKLWSKKEAQRIANEERTANQAPKPGILAGAMKPTVKKVKLVGKQEMNKEDFIKKMVARYGEDKMSQIEDTWNSIK